jgi:hypothetical protein
MNLIVQPCPSARAPGMTVGLTFIGSGVKSRRTEPVEASRKLVGERFGFRLLPNRSRPSQARQRLSVRASGSNTSPAQAPTAPLVVLLPLRVRVDLPAWAARG